MSWFKKGEEARQSLERQEQITQLLREKNVPRLWLKPMEEAPIIFVDDTAFWCMVHTIKIGNRYYDITCRSDLGPCPICMKHDRRPLGVTYFTVIDLRKFETRDGRLVKYRKVLLPARSSLAKKIFDYKKKYGSLVGAKVILKRYGERDPNCGDIIEIEKRADGTLKRYNIASLGKEYAIPFDYEKVLAPPTEEELKLLGFPVSVIGDTPIPEEDLISEEIFEEEEDIIENDEEEIFEDVGEEEEFMEEVEIELPEEGLGEINEEEDEIFEEIKEKKNAGRKGKK